MSNDQRTSGASNRNSDVFIPGLAVVYDADNFYEAGLFQRDRNGMLYMVSCVTGKSLACVLPIRPFF